MYNLKNFKSPLGNLRILVDLLSLNGDLYKY